MGPRHAYGQLALLFTVAAILVNGDILTAIRILLTQPIIVPQPNFASRVVTLLLTRPAPVALLAMALFYVCYLVAEQIPMNLNCNPSNRINASMRPLEFRYSNEQYEPPSLETPSAGTFRP